MAEQGVKRSLVLRLRSNVVVPALLLGVSLIVVSSCGEGQSDDPQSDPGCGPDEIVRANASGEWECSADLTANEAAAAAAQSTADTAVQYLRTIVVSPVGPTEADNGVELLAALDEAGLLIPPPSAANPVLVIVEPGTFNVTAGTFAERTIPPFVHVAGSGPRATRIKATVGNLGSPLFVFVLDNDTELRDLSIQIDTTLVIPTIGTGGIIIGNDQNVFFRNVRIIGPFPLTSHEAIKGTSGASVRLQNVEIEDALFAVRQIQAGTIEFDNLRTDRIIGADVGTVIGRGSIVGRLDAKNLGTISLATTQVLGNTIAVTTGTATCVFSYDASFAELDPMCEP